MNRRFKELRENFGLNQSEIGAKIGVSGAAVSRWESGERTIPDVAIRSVCREFGVSEQWLRDGIGDMFEARSRAEELSELTRSLFRERPDSFRAALVTTLLRFDPDGPEWAVLERIYNSLAAEFAQGGPPEESHEK